MVVRVHGRLAAKWSAGKLATAVGNHFVHVHVELRAAARHPNVQRKHVFVLTSEDLVANLYDEVVALVV